MEKKSFENKIFRGRSFGKSFEKKPFENKTTEKETVENNGKKKKVGKRSKYNPKFKNKDKYNKKKNYLIDTWLDTANYFDKIKNKIHIPPSIKYNLKTFERLNDINSKYVTYSNGGYEVLNQDSLNMTLEYIKQGLKPLLLNMASDFRPGGGVTKGKVSQEEEIFRRSNAYLTHPNSWYPLDNCEVIYSPEILVIKNFKDKKYNLIEEKKIGMITCMAIRNPKLLEGKYDEINYKLMYDKMEMIFQIAIQQNYDSIVLGVFSCGVFNNPQEEIAKIFKILINEYGKFFKKIGFAIPVIKKPDYKKLGIFKKIILEINKESINTNNNESETIN